MEATKPNAPQQPKPQAQPAKAASRTFPIRFFNRGLTARAI